MASSNELDEFLKSVERRAYKHALYSVRDGDTALDIVQDTMLRLVERYGDRPTQELTLLFFRILQNAIHDHFRRTRVRSLWTVMLSALSPHGPGEDESDPLDSLAFEPKPGHEPAPDVTLERSQVVHIIEEEISKLPVRQRQAFLMRYWEELDVAETARVMGCSEGSVKTHCSRATRALAAALQQRGISI